ncbi:Organic cation transporter protein [Chionoecetes opilio]|uniref:Organic cation transporter protein n=1 Tax=Chionoecetes opilio TaxID=41210 RepID=A0A8J5CEE8_CHIOP|nr:Organic cation transporter protein [Chionoecetes opilio]
MTDRDRSQRDGGVFGSRGGFGKYQKRMFLLLFLPTVVVSMQKLAWVFLAPKVDHRCRMWWEEENATYPMDDELKKLSYPWDEKDNNYDQCRYFSHALSCGSAQVYDTSEFQTSAVIDYGLVCERAWLRATVQSLYMVGMLLGSYVLGDASDRFGRKPVFLSALVVMVVVGIGQVAIPHYGALLVLRLLLGASLQGIFLVAYVISMEMVGKRSRTVVGVLAHGFYTIGYFVAALLAWLISSWRWLQVAMTLPALLFIPYYWIIPESARWLIAKGRSQEAQVILMKAAKVNGQEITEDVLEAAVKNDTDNKGKAARGNFLDLFRQPRMRLTTLNIFFNWVVNSGVYYGLSLNTSNLGGDPYLNFVISAAVEVPALAMATLLLDRVGRRIPLSAFLGLGGLFLVATVFVPQGMSWLLITLAMCSKLCITASYAIIYVLTAEVFPTVVRNVGVGSSSMVARVGGAWHPT